LLASLEVFVAADLIRALPHVEVAFDAERIFEAQPAEHDVARRLREPLALDDAVAVVGEREKSSQPDDASCAAWA
jgi:hypothetical protein